MIGSKRVYAPPQLASEFYRDDVPEIKKKVVVFKDLDSGCQIEVLSFGTSSLNIHPFFLSMFNKIEVPEEHRSRFNNQGVVTLPETGASIVERERYLSAVQLILMVAHPQFCIVEESD